MDDQTQPQAPAFESMEPAASVAEFPSEPFPCPACGQLLAPSCRKCVACKHVIDPAEIVMPQPVLLPTVAVESRAPQPAVVPYPWRLFFVFLGISFLLALIFEGLWGEQKAQLAMGGAQALAGIWVCFDALKHRLPRPVRWAVGTVLLPVIVFPWYLSRRRTPKAAVPFVEAEMGPVARFLCFLLLVFFLVSLIFYFVKGPQSAPSPSAPSNGHKGAGGTIALRIPAHPRERTLRI